MSAGDLKGRLQLDSSQADTALGRFDAKASAFADKVEHKLSKKINKMFGVGVAVGMIAHPLEKLKDALFGGTERAKGIEEEANKLHVTAEEYQMIAAAAKSSGVSVEEWLSKMKESGKPLSAIIADLEQFRGAIKFTNEEIETLTDDSLLKWLKEAGDLIAKTLVGGLKALSDGFAAMAILWNDPDKWRHPIEARNRALASIAADSAAQEKNREAEPASAGLVSALTKKGGGGLRPDFQINQLQKIGAYVGGSTDPTMESIKENTKATAEASRESAEALKALKESSGLFYGAGAGGDW